MGGEGSAARAAINWLNPQTVQDAIGLIQKAEDTGETDEIELGKLQNATMWKLRKFVDRGKAAGYSISM